MTEYPDTNGNGVPDAFENRLPISEVLRLPELEEQAARAVQEANTLLLEVEIVKRPACKGEMFILGGTVYLSSYDSSVDCLIVKRIVAAPKDWKPDNM